MSIEGGGMIGIEAGGTAMAGLGGFGEVGGLGIVNEGSVGLAALKLTVPLGEIKFNSESIPLQAKRPDIADVSFLSLRNHEVAKQSSSEYNLTQIALSPALPDPRNDELIEPMVVPFALPNIAPSILEFPKPETVVSPALEPAVQIGLQTKTGVTTEVRQATTTHSAQEEQEVEEEVVERVTAKQIDIVEEEEAEESRLKNVVDEEVLNARIKEFSSAVDIVGAEVEDGLAEIDGGKIVKLVPAETKKNRSGLVKEQGPDGSRVETIEEVASRKFGSVKEAKENIMSVIARKMPVKRGKEGKIVGYEAVARVLKYFFVKLKPVVEQMITKVVKKQKVQAQEGQKPSQIVPVAKPEATGSRIENLGLAEVFPKAV